MIYIVLMKVLHLLDTVNRGGAEMIALDVCRNAREYGIDLTFVTNQGGVMEEDFRASGAEFFRLQRNLPLDFKVVLQLRKIIKQKRIKIVQAYQAVDGLHLYFATVGLKNVKRVLSFQGFIADKKNRHASRFLIPQMDANIVVSRGLQKWLEKEDKLDTSKNFHLIYNGADTKRLQPSGKSLRKELNLDQDALLFGMVGNFYRDPRKDQLTLCKSLPRVFSEIENAHCLFAGKTETGAERKLQDCINFCSENGIAERVYFLGARSDISDILNALDLFVFSSLHEGLPIAVTEAMLAGVPMILSDIEPLLEVSENGKYAEIFPVQNEEILSEKIIKLLKDKKRREDLAKRTLEYAKKNFSIEAHIKNLKTLYANLI
ncbi:MAG: glycosyltransferase family 4 protein [Acidobacteria bacterium]|nr:glycosyltransferase family 4 protein [Acidobacteriota bacterium]MCA1639898.1 glycosyltransferase family 4 protein [Acidobacteriota bacterium]